MPPLQVKLKKYVKLSPATFAASLTRKRIAVIRASGNITGTEPGGLTSTGITAEQVGFYRRAQAARERWLTLALPQVIAQLKTCRKEKSIVAVVLRVDSPGGEATASDLMWREIRRTAEQKPVVASMGDVAASGLAAPPSARDWPQDHGNPDRVPRPQAAFTWRWGRGRLWRSP